MVVYRDLNRRPLLAIVVLLDSLANCHALFLVVGILNLGSGLSLRSVLTFLLVHIFADGVVDVVNTSETGAEDIRVDALKLAIELPR